MSSEPIVGVNLHLVSCVSQDFAMFGKIERPSNKPSSEGVRTNSLNYLLARADNGFKSFDIAMKEVCIEESIRIEETCDSDVISDVYLKDSIVLLFTMNSLYYEEIEYPRNEPGLKGMVPLMVESARTCEDECVEWLHNKKDNQPLVNFYARNKPTRRRIRIVTCFKVAKYVRRRRCYKYAMQSKDKNDARRRGMHIRSNDYEEMKDFVNSDMNTDEGSISGNSVYSEPSGDENSGGDEKKT